MGGANNLTPAEIAKIEALTTESWAQRRLSLEIGTDKKAVSNHQKRIKTGKELRKTTGTSKLSDRMIRFVIQEAQTGQF